MGEYGAQWRYASGAGEDQEKHDASVKLFYKLFNQWCIEMGMVPMAWCINYTGSARRAPYIALPRWRAYRKRLLPPR